VKLYQKAPEGLPSTSYTKYCSLDGDADRLLYFRIDHEGRFHMLDGDRFSVLFAFFIAKKLQEANLFERVKIGVIQTAYANGSSTAYIEKTMVSTIPGHRCFSSI
jgi:phosphoacetylglucosamine mutase